MLSVQHIFPVLVPSWSEYSGEILTYLFKSMWDLEICFLFCYVFLVCFLFYKYMLKVGCKPYLYSNQLQIRKFSFLVKAPSSNVYLRFLDNSSPDTFEAGVKNLYCSITI